MLPMPSECWKGEDFFLFARVEVIRSTKMQWENE